MAEQFSCGLGFTCVTSSWFWHPATSLSCIPPSKKKKPFSSFLSVGFLTLLKKRKGKKKQWVLNTLKITEWIAISRFLSFCSSLRHYHVVLLQGSFTWQWICPTRNASHLSSVSVPVRHFHHISQPPAAWDPSSHPETEAVLSLGSECIAGGHKDDFSGLFRLWQLWKRADLHWPFCHWSQAAWLGPAWGPATIWPFFCAAYLWWCPHLYVQWQRLEAVREKGYWSPSPQPSPL